MNGDPSKDSDHTIDAENMTVDEPDCMPDSVEVNTMSEANDVNGHSIQEIDVQIDAENSNLMNLTYFMTVLKPMMQIMSRQNKLLMMMLNKMMYPKILFKAYKTKLLVMMLRWKEQMRQMMLVVMLTWRNRRVFSPTRINSFLCL